MPLVKGRVQYASGANLLKNCPEAPSSEASGKVDFFTTEYTLHHEPSDIRGVWMVAKRRS